MQIILESADNGLIRTVIDSNADGANKKSEKKTIHKLESLDDSLMFLNQLAEDLGIFMGNINDKYTLQIKKEYSTRYLLSDAEKKSERKRLNLELNKLKLNKELTTIKVVSISEPRNMKKK